MIERLQRALTHIEELSPEAQADLAEQIEELIGRPDNLPGADEQKPTDAMPRSVQEALALAGAWSDLQGNDEFAALHGMRREQPPTPPTDEQLTWLDDMRP